MSFYIFVSGTYHINAGRLAMVRSLALRTSKIQHVIYLQGDLICPTIRAGLTQKANMHIMNGVT